MNPEKLLDAIGMLDDRHFEEEKKTGVIPWRRRLITFAAAVLAVLLLIGTAMAVSPALRQLIFSIIHIETHEQPPAGDPEPLPTAPSRGGLQEINVVNIDGMVHAHYFTSGGFVRTCEGGFYTCSWGGAKAVPEDAAFWELRTEGLVEVETTRVDFPLEHGDRTFRIVFDYAILRGKLSIKVWPQDLDENPYGNGWHAEPVGDRTDIALLSVPVDIGLDYTHDFLLLDLKTLETTDLLKAIPHDSLVIDVCQLTENLRYALLQSFDMEKGHAEYWLCDLERDTITSLEALTNATVTWPYFLDDSTIVFRETLEDGRFHVVRRHIPTGAQTVVVENTTRRSGSMPGYSGIQQQGGNGVHGLLFLEDGSVELIDLRTGEALHMAELNTRKLTTSESPDGESVLIAYEETNENGELGYGFSKLGILNPETGVLQLLTREISGDPESFWGWLDNNTVTILAQDAAGGYYVYVYEFRQ